MNLPSDEVPAVLIDSYHGAVKNALATVDLEPLRNYLHLEILRWAISCKAPNSAVWLLNGWAKDPELLPHLIDYIAELPERCFLFNEQLSSSFWAALALDSRLTSYASVRPLMRATREAILTPSLMLQTVGDSGPSNTRLAIACYSSYRAGLSINGIIRAMGVVVQSFDQAEQQIFEPPILDNMLREFQMLSSVYTDGDLPSADTQKSEKASMDLHEAYKKIANGAFGEHFGSGFAVYLGRRLQSDIERLRNEIYLHRRTLETIVYKRRRRTSSLFPLFRSRKDMD